MLVAKLKKLPTQQKLFNSFRRTPGGGELPAGTGGEPEREGALRRHRPPLRRRVRPHRRREGAAALRRQVHGERDRHDADQGGGGEDEGRRGGVSGRKARDQQGGTDRGVGAAGGVVRQRQGELLPRSGVQVFVQGDGAQVC